MRRPLDDSALGNFGDSKAEMVPYGHQFTTGDQLAFQLKFDRLVRAALELQNITGAEIEKTSDADLRFAQQHGGFYLDVANEVVLPVDKRGTLGGLRLNRWHLDSFGVHNSGGFFFHGFGSGRSGCAVEQLYDQPVVSLADLAMRDERTFRVGQRPGRLDLLIEQDHVADGQILDGMKAKAADHL